MDNEPSESANLAGTMTDAFDEKLALKDSQHFHDVINVQAYQVTSGIPEDR